MFLKWQTKEKAFDNVNEDLINIFVAWYQDEYLVLSMYIRILFQDARKYELLRAIGNAG